MPQAADLPPREAMDFDVVIVDELPHTATGKVMKTRLRELYGSHVTREAAPESARL